MWTCSKGGIDLSFESDRIVPGSVSSLAWFMSNQETSFVTIGQGLLASPLRVRFHYGHPDICDRILHIKRGGISKASKTINFSEDIFAGYRAYCVFLLCGRLYLVMSGMERHILNNSIISRNKSLEAALIPQSVFQMGTLSVLPMLLEISLEKGFRTALGDFIIMQLQLASVFFTFQLGTKAHYFGRTILHGGSKYRATGRGFVVFHAKFADNYRLYSRSHFVKGLELSILLILYQVYGESYRSSNIYLLITCSIWFRVGSWLLAPFVFNPCSFDWQKTVDDWTD
ncbi:hypothetical protein QUC31_005802 [Theobroma cacao]